MTGECLLQIIGNLHVRLTCVDIRCAVLSDWTVAFRYVALVTTNGQLLHDQVLRVEGSLYGCPSSALFGLRVYAICGRMKIILLLAVALTGARVGINVWVRTLCLL